MTTAESANFLNLDLEIESRSDLSALAQHMGEQVLVLFNGATERGFRLALEPIIETALSRNPQACLNHFVTLLRSLPVELTAIWNDCTSRVFDYGFDGGFESPPQNTTICANSLLQIANLGADVRITIYPFQAEEIVIE